MKADQIIKNAKIFTADMDNPTDIGGLRITIHSVQGQRTMKKDRRSGGLNRFTVICEYITPLPNNQKLIMTVPVIFIHPVHSDQICGHRNRFRKGFFGIIDP